MKRLSQLIVATMLALSLAGGAIAQEDGEKKKQQTIGERVYKRLEQAHAALGEKQYADVVTKLRQMEDMPLNDYERALVYQTYGFLYAEQGQYGQALQYFERCLALDALPDPAQQGMLFSLAGLYSAEGKYRKTIETMQRWLPNEPDPRPDAFIMLAAAHAELNEYPQAKPWVEKAIAKSDKPKENWYQLLVAIQFELKQYSEAAQTLRRMVGYWPDKLTYWEMLSGAYQQTGQDLQATSAMNLAYRKGLVGSQSKILNLVRMMLFIEDPFQAAQLLEKEMNAGVIEATQKNLELLLSAWTAAKEFDKAIAVIDRLAPMTGDGNYYLQKAQLYAERTAWAEVIPAAEQAIARGGLKKPGAPWLLKGMSEAELGQLSKAIDSLTQAKNIGDRIIRAQADGWIQYVGEQQKARVKIATSNDDAAAE
ncbi:MAG: tetratricopeptide repeat protein [Gammaproteobacteria bacterium]|nr:tetratricopeptide repeat protein [Gammaproteobacteria bacterium]NND58950.1 tetratricopeptide repeat protein [Gammaproteobacteria bacterium]